MTISAWIMASFERRVPMFMTLEVEVVGVVAEEVVAEGIGSADAIMMGTRGEVG